MNPQRPSTASCLLPLPPAVCLIVTGAHDRLDVAADVEVAFDLDFHGVARRDEVFEDDVDDMLVENLHVAERVDVKFQALEFDAALRRDVLDAKGREVREVGERADAGELRQLEADAYLTARIFIGEGVERVEVHLLARRRAYVEALLVRGRRAGLGRLHLVYSLNSSPNLNRPARAASTGAIAERRSAECGLRRRQVFQSAIRNPPLHNREESVPPPRLVYL